MASDKQQVVVLGTDWGMIELLQAQGSIELLQAQGSNLPRSGIGTSRAFGASDEIFLSRPSGNLHFRDLNLAALSAPGSSWNDGRPIRNG